MATNYAILSGFKDETDTLGEEIGRGLEREMKRLAVELCTEDSPYLLLEVVHHRRGRVSRRNPRAYAGRISMSLARNADKAKRDAAAAEEKRLARVDALKKELEGLEPPAEPAVKAPADTSAKPAADGKKTAKK